MNNPVIPKSWTIGPQVTDTCRIYLKHFGYSASDVSIGDPLNTRRIALDCSKKLARDMNNAFNDVDLRTLYKAFLYYVFYII